MKYTWLFQNIFKVSLWSSNKNMHPGPRSTTLVQDTKKLKKHQLCNDHIPLTDISVQHRGEQLKLPPSVEKYWYKTTEYQQHGMEFRTIDLLATLHQEVFWQFSHGKQPLHKIQFKTWHNYQYYSRLWVINDRLISFCLLCWF